MGFIAGEKAKNKLGSTGVMAKDRLRSTDLLKKQRMGGRSKGHGMGSRKIESPKEVPRRQGKKGGNKQPRGGKVEGRTNRTPTPRGGNGLNGNRRRG